MDTNARSVDTFQRTENCSEVHAPSVRVKNESCRKESNMYKKAIGREIVENSKRELLEVFKTLQNFDIESAPGFYFAKELYDLLVDGGLSEASADMIVANIAVNLSGLKNDLDDHKEFLYNLATVSAPILHKMWVKGNLIGEQFAINMIKTFKVWLE